MLDKKIIGSCLWYLPITARPNYFRFRNVCFPGNICTGHSFFPHNLILPKNKAVQQTVPFITIYINNMALRMIKKIKMHCIKGFKDVNISHKLFFSEKKNSLITATVFANKFS